MNCISQSSFVVSLVILEEVSSVLPTTRLLQTSSLDVVEAMTNVDNLLESLHAMRSPEKFHNMCITGCGIAEYHVG